MSKLKKFFIVFLSFFPLTAAAFWPWVLAGVGTAVAGFSIWRSVAPVDMNDALQFFSSCWTCQMFSAVMVTMSTILPRIFSEIGRVIIPMALMLTAVYFTWTIVSGFLNSKIESGWSITSKFTTHMIKLAVICAVLVLPLPRMISNVVIEPIFNIGMSVNHIVGDSDKFAECMVATTLMDDSGEIKSIRTDNMPTGAFPVKLRSGLACELASVHQVTGLGMAVGWTMLNMAFSYDYMHKIMWGIPIFPNVPIFFAGLLVLVLYFMAMLPIPLYFLEIFVGLSLDFIMLPLMLIGWLFKDWKIAAALNGGKNIQGMIDDVIKGAVGIAITVVFLIFGIMFLDTIVGNIDGLSRIATAITENDSKILMDGLLMRNDSLVTIILLGVFFAMFMTSIPALVKTLFNIQISDKFYQTAKKDFLAIRALGGKWWKTLKK